MGTGSSLARTSVDALAKVRLGNFGLNVSGWKNISENAKGLIRMLLEMNPEDSDNAKRTPNHEWITSHAPEGRLASCCKKALLTTSGASVGRLSSSCSQPKPCKMHSAAAPSPSRVARQPLCRQKVVAAAMRPVAQLAEEYSAKERLWKQN